MLAAFNHFYLLSVYLHIESNITDRHPEDRGILPK